MHRAILLWLFTHMNLITVSCILNKTLEDNDDDTKGDIIIELVPDDPGIDTYDQNDVKWIQTAIINIGYYLRSHKFNEFDRRLVIFALNILYLVFCIFFLKFTFSSTSYSLK